MYVLKTFSRDSFQSYNVCGCYSTFYRNVYKYSIFMKNKKQRQILKLISLWPHNTETKNNIIKKTPCSNPMNFFLNLFSTASQFTQHIQNKPCFSTSFWNALLIGWVKTFRYTIQVWILDIFTHCDFYSHWDKLMGQLNILLKSINWLGDLDLFYKLVKLNELVWPETGLVGESHIIV